MRAGAQECSGRRGRRAARGRAAPVAQGPAALCVRPSRPRPPDGASRPSIRRRVPRVPCAPCRASLLLMPGLAPSVPTGARPLPPSPALPPSHPHTRTRTRSRPYPASPHPHMHAGTAEGSWKGGVSGSRGRLGRVPVTCLSHTHTHTSPYLYTQHTDNIHLCYVNTGAKEEGPLASSDKEEREDRLLPAAASSESETYSACLLPTIAVIISAPSTNQPNQPAHTYTQAAWGTRDRSGPDVDGLKARQERQARRERRGPLDPDAVRAVRVCV